MKYNFIIPYRNRKEQMMNEQNEGPQCTQQ